MPENSRLQVKTSADPVAWEDVGAGAVGVPVPVTVEGGVTIATSPVITENKYSTNHLDDYTTTNVTYVGQEDSAGVWKIIKIDETGNFPVFTYATVANNPTLTTYATAWAARATTATYNVYSTAA